MLSYLKKKYLNGIGFVRPDDNIENNYFEKEYTNENTSKSSEHKQTSNNGSNRNSTILKSPDNKPLLTKPDGTVMIDYRRSKLNKIEASSNTNSSNSSSSHTNSTHNNIKNHSNSNHTTNNISKNSNHTTNNISKSPKNETNHINKKPISLVKPEYKRPTSSLSKIDYKRPSSSLSKTHEKHNSTNTTTSTSHKTSTLKKSTYPNNTTTTTTHSTLKKSDLPKKPELPKKPLKRESISNLNSLKRSNSQSQISSKIATRTKDNLNRLSSPNISLKKKEVIGSTTTTTTTKKQISNLATKKSSTLTTRKSSTTPLKASTIVISKKKEDNPISSIPKIPSPLQSLNETSPVSNLYEIVNKYKKLNDSPVLTAQDKKLKRNTIDLPSNTESKSTTSSLKNHEIKRSTTLNSKDDNKMKSSVGDLKEEKRISERFDNIKKTINTYPVTKTSSLTKSIKEKEGIKATSESKSSSATTKAKLDAFNAKVANLNNAIENRNRRSSVASLKSSVDKDRKSSISNLKSAIETKERKNTISNLNNAIENKSKRNSIASIVSDIESKDKKGSTDNLKKSLNDAKEKKSSISNLTTSLRNKERIGSVDNLKHNLESKIKKSSTDSVKVNKTSSINSTNHTITQNPNQPIKIISKDTKMTNITPKTSLLFNTENNKLREEPGSINEEKSSSETENKTTQEIKETSEPIKTVLPPTPMPGISKILSDQVSEATLASQNTEDLESSASSSFTSPTLNSSRKESLSLSSPALSNIGTMNMTNLSRSGSLKKKRSGWWDNIKDKNEEKQLIKESIRSLPLVNIKAEDREDEDSKPLTNKYDFVHHKSSSVDSIHLNNLPESKFIHLLNITDNNNSSNNNNNNQIRVENNFDDDIYKKSMNEIELLMNKAKLSDQNDSIIGALDIIINFCKENGFNKTLESLREESKYYTNTENTKNIKKYFESRSFDSAITYIKNLFSKYKPSDIPNYDEITKSYNDLLYVLYRYQYINLIQKRKMNEAKVKILNVIVKKRVINSYAIGGDYAKYFEDDNFYLSELLIRGPLSASNPYKAFNMNIHLKQFWTKSYAEKEVLNYWPFLEMFFNENKSDKTDTNNATTNTSNSTSIPLNNLIKLSKGVQEVIDNCYGNANANGIASSDSISIKSHKINTPTMTTLSNDSPKEMTPSSVRLKHSVINVGKSDTKLTRTNSTESFKSTTSLRSRLLRESSKSSIKLSGALPLTLGHKTSNSSINSDIYSSSLKSTSSFKGYHVGDHTNTNRINSHSLSKKTSQVFDGETTSNTKPIRRLSKTRYMSLSRSNSATGNYSNSNSSNKRNSVEINPRNSYHGGDFPNFTYCTTPINHYVDDDAISYNTFSDNNSIYSLSSCDWLNFDFDGFIGPYAGGIRAMDVQYTSKKDGCGNPIDGVFGQLVVAVAIDRIQDHSISIWDAHTKTCLATMLNTNSSGTSKAVEIIKFHPTLPNVFLTSDQDFDVKLWDWTKGSVDANGNYRIEPIRVWKKFHKRIIHKMDFLPNNPMYAISCSGDNTIQIWNIDNDDNKNNNNIKRIVSNNPISSFTFANNNQYLVAASMYILRVYDMENFKLINTIELEDLKSSKMTINYMETHITNDNLLLLSCASNVILYDLAHTTGLRVFDSPYISPDQKIEGHFSPYGQYVYSSSIIPKYFASLPTTENLPNFQNINNPTTNDVNSVCSGSMVNSIDMKSKEGTGFYVWNVDNGRFEISSIKQMEKDVEPYLSTQEKVTVCQWINVPCINDPDTNAQIFILGTTDKILRFYCFCDCHLTD